MKVTSAKVAASSIKLVIALAVGLTLPYVLAGIGMCAVLIVVETLDSLVPQRKVTR